MRNLSASTIRRASGSLQNSLVTGILTGNDSAQRSRAMHKSLCRSVFRNPDKRSRDAEQGITGNPASVHGGFPQARAAARGGAKAEQCKDQGHGNGSGGWPPLYPDCSRESNVRSLLISFRGDDNTSHGTHLPGNNNILIPPPHANNHRPGFANVLMAPALRRGVRDRGRPHPPATRLRQGFGGLRPAGPVLKPGSSRADARGWVAWSSHAMVRGWKRKPGLKTSPWAGSTRPPSGDAGLNARRRARLGGAVEPRHGEGVEAEMRLQDLTIGGLRPADPVLKPGLIARRRARLGGMVKPCHGERRVLRREPEMLLLSPYPASTPFSAPRAASTNGDPRSASRAAFCDRRS